MNQQESNIKYFGQILAIALIGMIMLLFELVQPLGWTRQYLTGDWVYFADQMQYGAIIFVLIIIITCHLIFKRPYKDMGICVPHKQMGMFIVHGLFLTACIVITYFITQLSRLLEFNSLSIGLKIIVNFIAIAWINEIIFRGFLLQNFERMLASRGILGTIIAAVLVSLMFGITYIPKIVMGVDTVSINSVISAISFPVALSVYLCILYHFTNNLWCCTVIHGVFLSLAELSADFMSPIFYGIYSVCNLIYLIYCIIKYYKCEPQLKTMDGIADELEDMEAGTKSVLPETKEHTALESKEAVIIPKFTQDKPNNNLEDNLQNQIKDKQKNRLEDKAVHELKDESQGKFEYKSKEGLQNKSKHESKSDVENKLHDKPKDKSLDKSIGNLLDKSVDRSVDQPISNLDLVDKSTSKLVDKSVDKSTSKLVDKSVDKPISNLEGKSVNKSENVSVDILAGRLEDRLQGELKDKQKGNLQKVVDIQRKQVSKRPMSLDDTVLLEPIIQENLLKEPILKEGDLQDSVQNLEEEDDLEKTQILPAIRELSDEDLEKTMIMPAVVLPPKQNKVAQTVEKEATLSSNTNKPLKLKPEPNYIAHLENYLGEFSGMFRQMTPTDPPIDVLFFRGERYNTLVTNGMRSIPIKLPAELGHYQYLELMMFLDKSIDINQSNIESDENAWLIKLLIDLSLFPKETGSYLGVGNIVGNGENLEPYSAESAYCGALIFPPIEQENVHFYRYIEKDTTTYIYNVMPLFKDELRFIQEHSADQFINLMSQLGVRQTIKRDRINVIKEMQEKDKL